MDLNRLSKQLNAQQDTDLELATDLFTGALRAGDMPRLVQGATALLNAPRAGNQLLLHCAERLHAMGRAPELLAAFVLRLARRGQELVFTLPGHYLETEDIVRLVDRDVVVIHEPLAFEVTWDPARRARLLLRGAEHVLPLYERAFPGDDRPHRILAAYADHHGLRPGRHVPWNEGRRLADDLWDGRGTPLDLGWGLVQMFEGRGTRALEEFRQVRGRDARRQVWDCYDEDGRTFVAGDIDPLLQRSLEEVEGHGEDAYVRALEDDAADAQDEIAALFGLEPEPRRARTSNREMACIHAQEIAERSELHWQMGEALTALLGLADQP